MNGITKLKAAVLVLFLLMSVSFVFSWMIATIEENATVDEYEDLSYDDQRVLTRFYDKLPDYTNIYAIIGWIYVIVAGGLFLLLTKLWYLKKI